MILSFVVGAAYFITDLPGTLGAVHEDFPSMQKGGQPPDRMTVLLGWLFGFGAISLIFSMFGLSTVRNGSFRGAGWPILAVYVATLIVWSAIVVAYSGYVEDPDQTTLFGWPLPTGLTLFVFLPVMFLINIVFVVYFPRSILSEDDLQQFEQKSADNA